MVVEVGRSVQAVVRADKFRISGVSFTLTQVRGQGEAQCTSSRPCGTCLTGNIPYKEHPSCRISLMKYNPNEEYPSGGTSLTRNIYFEELTYAKHYFKNGKQKKTNLQGG